MADLDDELAPRAAFLRKFPWLRPLSESDLRLLLSRMEEWKLEDGANLVFEHEFADRARFVLEGCLQAVSPGQSPVYTGPGEVWGLADLFQPGPSHCQVSAVGSTRILTLTHKDLVNVLQQHPSLKRKLSARPALPPGLWPAFSLKLNRPVGRNHFLIQAGEQIEVFARRSAWFLVTALLPPALVFLASAALGLSLSLHHADFRDGLLLWLFPGALMFLALAYSLVKIGEWRNNFLLLTDRFLIQKQLNLFQRKSSFRKIPLSQVETTEMVKTGFLNFLLRLGTLTIKSSAWGGGMVFSHLPKPQWIEARLNDLLDARRAEDTSAQRLLHRQVLQEQFGSTNNIRRLDVPGLKPAGETDEIDSQQRTFFWRKEKNGVITYRKHPVLFFLKIGPWVFALLALVAFLVLVSVLWPGSNQVFLAIGLGGALILGGRVWWETVDWVNDRFQIEAGHIRAIHKRPLWLGEQRREAALDRIQEVSLKKNGLLALIFDFGDLVIQTAGEAQPLLFEMVGHPEWIQSEIFLKKLEREAQAEEDGKRGQFKEFAQFVDVYHQAIEQGVIPARKPKD